MMTKEEYYAQIEEMYAQKYESKDKKIEAANRRFREYLMRRNDDDDETDWWYRSEKENPEDQVLNDEELVETEVETKASGIEDQAVENEANSKMISAIVKEESIPQFLMVTEADSTCVQHTNVILQQVSISPLEHSLNFCKANLDVMGNCQYAMGKTHQIWSDSNFGCVNDDACQVFDVIPMRTKVLPKEHKERFHKSWRFKFKHRVASRESKAGFEVNMKHNQSKEMLLQLLLSGTHKKRQRKTPKYHKTWKFRFKNMELQRIMTQLDTQHFIFRWDSECILHLSTVVHHLETSHKQSSFAIDALKSDFGVDVIIFHGEQQFGCRVVMLHLKKRGTYEFSGQQLQDLRRGEAESFPLLNFAAEQPFLWMQNNCEPVLTVSELERKKKKLCYKTWMFKYKVPHLDEKILETSDQCIRKRGLVSADQETEDNQLILRSFMWVIQNCLNQYMVLLLASVAYDAQFSVGVGKNKKQLRLSLRNNQIWDPGGKFLYISQGSTSTLQRRISLPCCTNIFLLNLEVKVFSKGKICYRNYGSSDRRLWASQAHYLFSNNKA